MQMQTHLLEEKCMHIQTHLYPNIIVCLRRFSLVNMVFFVIPFMLCFSCLRYERFRSGRSSAQSVNNGVSQQLVTQVVKRPITAHVFSFSDVGAFSVSILWTCCMLHYQSGFTMSFKCCYPSITYQWFTRCACLIKWKPNKDRYAFTFITNPNQI